MTAPDALPTEVRGYLEAVHRHLGDLPPADRAELLAPIEARLAELADGPGSLAEVELLFGPPARLATELRTAAGYPAATAPGWWLAESLSGLLERAPVVAVVGYVSSLRPAWWAVRGYLLLGGVLGVLGPEQYRLHTIGSYKSAFTDATTGHGSVLWALVPGLAVIASVALGLRTSRLPSAVRYAVLALNAAAVVVVLAFPSWWLPPAGVYFAGLVN
jgi:hypothetical protein